MSGTSWIAGILLASMVASCQPPWATPESRARDFIELLVTAPAELEQLRGIANLAPGHEPEELLGDLSARIGLDYLRAMQSRDVTLNFSQGETRDVGEARRTVKVHVTYPQPGAPAAGEVRFLVRLEKAGQDAWRVARVTGDN